MDKLPPVGSTQYVELRRAFHDMPYMNPITRNVISINGPTFRKLVNHFGIPARAITPPEEQVPIVNHDIFLIADIFITVVRHLPPATILAYYCVNKYYNTILNSPLLFNQLGKQGQTYRNFRPFHTRRQFIALLRVSMMLDENKLHTDLCEAGTIMCLSDHTCDRMTYSFEYCNFMVTDRTSSGMTLAPMRCDNVVKDVQLFAIVRDNK